ncbi:hypothetical protein OG241_08045 [Streptomyces sp. NBC_01390]
MTDHDWDNPITGEHGPDITNDGSYPVRWEIDSDEGVSPVQAALDVWP